MFLTTVKVILEFIVNVFFIGAILLSIYYLCSKDYRQFIYETVKYVDDPDFLDWLMVILVLPAVLLKSVYRKILNALKKCATIVRDCIKPKTLKVVIYYVPKHWKCNQR